MCLSYYVTFRTVGNCSGKQSEREVSVIGNICLGLLVIAVASSLRERLVSLVTFVL